MIDEKPSDEDISIVFADKYQALDNSVSDEGNDTLQRYLKTDRKLLMHYSIPIILFHVLTRHTSCNYCYSLPLIIHDYSPGSTNTSKKPLNYFTHFQKIVLSSPLAKHLINQTRLN